MRQNGTYSKFQGFLSVLRRFPNAKATLRGSGEYPSIHGKVYFYQTKYGVLVVSEINGLPDDEIKCDSPVFGFHIHEGGSCTGNSDDPFADALGHYNPDNCEHPHHAGDMPPLFSNNGYAFSVFLTDSFLVSEVKGKTVIIHSMPDDFKTQPSGDSGKKIACGVII